MNNKIPIKLFAEKLAKECGVSPEEAQQFVKLYFEAVAQKLRSGEEVTVGGLGTFALTHDSSMPVSFTPSEEAAAEVNSPFDMFEPMELPNGVSGEDLDAAVAPEVPEVPEASEVVESTDNIPEQQEEVPTEPVAVTQEPVAEAVDSVEAVAAEAPAEIIEKEEPVVEVQEASIEPVVESTNYIPEDEEEYVPVAVDKNGPSFGLGFLVGILTGLIIGAVALYLYAMYYVNTPVAGV